LKKQKKDKRALPPLHLKLLLIFSFMIFSLSPVLIQGYVQNNSFEKSITDERSAELQNQSLILSSQLSRDGYLKTAKADTGLETEMDSVASAYNGRILVINSDYRIIRDTFNLATGKYHIAPEIIRCFNGENSNTVNEKLHYIVQTTPIYESVSADDAGGNPSAKPEPKTVKGVLLFLSSTENMRSYIRESSNKMILLDVILGLILLVFSIVISSFLVRPLIKLRDDLGQVAQGDLNRNVSENTYDVTKQISAGINQTIKKLKETDQTKDEFVSNVSHELKTPITSIRVLADSLMSTENVPVEQYREFMMDISKEIDRESKIINDLLDLVKMDRSANELNRTSADMHAMLEQILKRLRPIAKMNEVELTLESVREVTADVDEMKFSLAISNLVENAIKYNVKNGWVRVTLDADHQFCFIRVEDSGIGIPKESVGYIFDRFYRVDKARSRETGGTGLGLSITKNIIMMHKGNIKVTSKEGEGTTFLVRIPLNYRGGA